MVFIAESVFVLAEAFDDDLLADAVPHLDYSDILFVPSDIDDDFNLHEDEATAVLATGKCASTCTRRLWQGLF